MHVTFSLFFLYFVFGLMFGGGLRFWLFQRHNIFIHLVFLYIFGAWVFTVGIGVLGADFRLKACFLVGFSVAFFKQAVSVYWFFYDEIMNIVRERRSTSREHKHRGSKQEQKKPDFEQQTTYQAEQARREAEARQYREQQRKAKEPPKTEETKKEPPPRQPAQEVKKTTKNRTYAEILGLQPNWTEEDLKTAYKREAGRTHPDKWRGKPESIMQAMEEEYKAIQEAYKRLKK